ncbi:MAG: peptidase domain-containing ABC transporter [Bacteroidales bacterium]|jgi:ATP-binding cassette subfamily B protein|nr:peptidase domain-containing ABC transporter [Bacteroidales bacterium]
MRSFPFFQQFDAMDCGVACLKMIAKFYGKSYNTETLINLSYYTRKGVSLKSLSYTAEKIGFRTIAVNTSYDKLLTSQPNPFIVFWKQNHFIVVYKITKKIVLVADPERGKYKINKNDFLNGWANSVENGINKGICLLLTPLPDFYKKQEDKKISPKGIKFLFSYLLPYKKLMFQLFIGLILGSLLQLVFPFLMQNLVDVGVKQQDIKFIYILLLAYFVLILSSTFIEIIRSWILLHISTRINISLVSDFLIKLMKLPITFFETKMIGDLKQRIDDNYRIENFLTNSTLSILFSFVNVAVFSIVLGIYSLKILLIFYIFTIIYIIWTTLFLKKRKQLDILRFGQSSENQNVLYKLISSMQEIKLNNAEQHKRWEWENLQAKIFQLNIKQLSLSQFQFSGGIFFSSIMFILISVTSATAVIEGNISLGMMLSIQYIIGQLTSPLEQAVVFINSFQDAKISLERLAEIHLKEDEIKDIIYKNISDIEEKTIFIENLSFQYEGPYSPKILDNINLKIEKNKITAIVGVSGSGKTTLMKLLLGLYKQVDGSIKIGNNFLSSYHNSEWRGVVGAVMQDGIIFSDTIANNITIGHDEIDLEQLEYAAKMADIHDFIMSMPLKYNTKIGDDGNGLSQGQKQRILIARAIYKNPKFVFFDEATNNLDAKSEKTILSNLDSFFKNRTVLIIAHRLSTVKNADKIVVFEKGKIVESGKHEDLINLKGIYYELVKNQLELGQ